MNNILRIYLDFLLNVFDLLFIFHFAHTAIHKKPNYKLFCILLILKLIYSLPAHVPFNFIVTYVVSFITIYIICNQKIKDTFTIFLKYECVCTFILPIIYVLHSIAVNDFTAVIESAYYRTYKDLICISVLYIFYALLVYTKKMKLFKTAYIYYFNTILCLIVIFLSYISLRALKNTASASYLLPIMFTVVYLLVLAFLFIYGRLIDVLQENALSKIQLQQNILTAEYGASLEKNLDEVRRIRHDIRNHLIIIDDYAARNETDKIRVYIGKITECFSQTKVIQTPSAALSALLNAKYQEGLRLNITCDFSCEAPNIFIMDFHLMTIMGNLLDNAILAASKLENGFVLLTIRQIDSYLEIFIKNNHREHIKEKGGIFLSTKPDKTALNGIGIKNVRSAVKMLNGHIDFPYTETEFEVSVLLPNYQTKSPQS